MNNSRLAIEGMTLQPDEKVDITNHLREREQKLIRTIEAIRGVSQTTHWSTLKTEIFDGLVKTLKSELFTEAKKENPDNLKQNRIAGQLKWAEKFSDLSKLEEQYRVELLGLRKQYGKQSE